MTELTSAVREAQADADRRFGAGPVQPWEPPPVLSEATQRRIAAVALACLLTTALLVALAVAKTAPAPASGAAPADPPPSRDAPAEGEITDHAAPLPAPPLPDVTPALALERQGAEWHLSAQGAARHEVVHRLAQASGATLYGSTDAVLGARPVQLQWQGCSLAQLWPLVLGPELNFALRCRRERCEVWLLGPARPAASPIALSRSSPPFETPSLPMPLSFSGTEGEGQPIRD